MNNNVLVKLRDIRRRCTKSLLSLYFKANAGHIASSLSCLDILVYLYFNKISVHDKFILSKGHAAAALYTVLGAKGFVNTDELNTYYCDGTVFAAHPPCGSNKIKGITFGTGSLGHGLSLAAGLALSTKFSGKKFNVYCVVSDGDCNEGSTWEAVMFAAQHKLKNLTVIVDNNKLQGFGRTEEVIDMEPLVKKWESFNFDVVESKNGNDFSNLDEAFNVLEKNNSDKPKCIIARTTKGSGISFMEDKLEWHYLPMNEDQYKAAIEEIGDIDA